MSIDPITDRAIQALRELVKREHGVNQVALVAGVSAANLRQIINGIALPTGKPRGIGRELREKLSRAYPGWDQQQANAPLVTPPQRPQEPKAIAVEALEPTRRYLTQFNWESLMRLKSLPTTFWVNMPDDSMSPRVKRGDLLEFDTTLQPKPGDGVIVRDNQGQLYFRVYRQARVGEFEAHAIDPEYLPMHSVRDALTVVAVLVGVPKTRWA
jgi:hypothetical protein